ncbi:unnamed protein product [Bursaphelenchus okinawaensis]|uniref:Intraflagellar transport protein 122 homolog n=1 Tax=Bursaphelenchus okinawaensis TaxID=465554 RepID=A0A811KPY8_9BILA|nr:unnamed protein product [Bursaphelenchus okinawaensis]CAG9110872.1 unnamed protein product [Bursaphelenchus okinawaensis]
MMFEPEKPDGSQLLAAADNRVLVYDPKDGTLVTSLKGHKDLVYCVAFSFNGEKFASGSLDKTVIVWNDQHEGLLKYTHNDSIQCLAFSPVAMTLLSCAVTDFGIWNQNDKNVSKQRVNVKCTCCAWSSDGQYYAIGFSDGSVSIRSASAASIADEFHKFSRPSGEPIWDLSFGLTRQNNHSTEVLAVVDWNQSVGFYTFDGRATHRADKILTYDATLIEFFNNSQFLLLGGSNHAISIHTRDGAELGTLARADSWIWTAKARPNQPANNVNIVMACTDGTLASYTLMFSTVHSLHKDLYAYRDMLTDVVVQQLGRQRCNRIRLNTLVCKVAIYHNRLAVQVTDRILVFRQSSGEKEGEQVEYKLMDRINRDVECSLLVVTAHHVILCDDKRLQCIDHKGQKQREWTMESSIRYIKVIGGPPGREAILLGLKNGLVCKIFVDNPFPVEVVRLRSGVRCLDVSLSKRKLAIVDENNVCMMFDIVTKELISQEPNITSVAFNSENEDLICYTGENRLFVKAKNFTPYQQRIEGFVVGFTGRRFHCLHTYTMTTNEIPLGSQLSQYLNTKDFAGAYELAVLGVTEKDWQILGLEALENMEFEVAKKAFHRIKDCRALLLINEIEDMKNCGKSADTIRAHIYAFNRRFRDAARVLQETGAEQHALDMFADLRMFDQAQEFLATASNETQKSLLRKKADWATEANDMRLAAEMLMASGDYDKAIKIMMQNDWTDKILQMATRLDRSDANVIREIGNYLAAKGEFTIAAGLFGQIGDIISIAMMHVKAENWEDAFAVVERHPALATDVYLPYARWLSERDMFDEAQIAYSKAGHDREAFEVLQTLAEKAIAEHRYLDGSYYFRLMAKNYMDKEDLASRQKIEECLLKSDLYYVYNSVYKYVIEPFTEKGYDVLCNMARYLSLSPKIAGISQVNVLFVLTRLSMRHENYKTAREALGQLRIYRIPPKFQNSVDMWSMEVRSKAYSDSDEFMPMCYSCGTTNPVLGGHLCAHCNAPFVYSFLRFEVLPVLEFQVPEDLSTEEAKELLKAEPPIDEGDQHVNRLLSDYRSKNKSGILTLEREDLANLETNLTFVAELPQPIGIKFYLKVIPEIPIAQCEECKKLFHADDFQLSVLQHGVCPVCRFKVHLYEPDLDEDDTENS